MSPASTRTELASGRASSKSCFQCLPVRHETSRDLSTKRSRSRRDLSKQADVCSKSSIDPPNSHIRKDRVSRNVSLTTLTNSTPYQDFTQMISHPRSAFTEQSLHQKIHADRTLSIPDLREITREQLQRTVNVREEFIDAAGMHVARLQDEVQIQDVRAKIDDAEGQVLDAKAQGLDVGSLGEKEVKERLCTLVEQQWNFLEKGKALE